MDDEPLKRALNALNTVNAGSVAAHRALEYVVLALVASHPNKKKLLGIIEHLLEFGKEQAVATQDKDLPSAYDFHRKRLLEEIQSICTERD